MLSGLSLRARSPFRYDGPYAHRGGCRSPLFSVLDAIQISGLAKVDFDPLAD